MAQKEQSATQILMAKVETLIKQNEDLKVTIIGNHTAMLEELAVVKEKLANSEKKKPAARTGAKQPAASPTGKVTKQNRMNWFKETFAENYDDWIKELFTAERGADGVVAEAEAEIDKGKGKDKEGKARYKLIAGVIWTNCLKSDVEKYKDLKAEVFRRYDEYNNDSDPANEATADANDDAAEPAAPETDASESDAVANDNEDEEPEKPKTPAKKAPVKKAPAAAAKAPAKGAKAPVKKAPAKK